MPRRRSDSLYLQLSKGRAARIQPATYACTQLLTVGVTAVGGTLSSWPTSRYSIRNAWVGLMEAARRAGIQAAINATRTSMAGISVNVTASCGWMP